VKTDPKSEWNQLARIHCDQTSLIDSCFKELEDAYSEPQRFYHTLTHILHLLTLVEEYAELFEDIERIKFAVWYHDFVYQPLRKDNEVKSAEVCKRRMARIGFPQYRRKASDDLIIATRDHVPPPHLQGIDNQLMLDFDLAILGSSPETYETYSKQIRKEFKVVPFFLYKRGRKKILSRYLERDYIYCTEIARDRWESQARINMENELNSL